MTQSPQESADVRAREVLALEYEKIGDGLNAARIRAGAYVCEEVDVAVSAILATLQSPPGAGGSIGEEQIPSSGVRALNLARCLAGDRTKVVHLLTAMREGARREQQSMITLAIPTVDAILAALVAGETSSERSKS